MNIVRRFSITHVPEVPNKVSIARAVYTRASNCLSWFHEFDFGGGRRPRKPGVLLERFVRDAKVVGQQVTEVPG